MNFQYYEAPALCHEDAVHVILEGLDYRIDPRKVLWASYPARQNRIELEEKAEKEIDKLLKEEKRELEEGNEVYANSQWYVGVPRFKVVKRDIPHLSVTIDLYLVVTLCSSSPDEDPFYYSQWGRLVPKADGFEFPLALLDSLPKALAKGELEVDGAQVADREDGWTTYEFLGEKWRVPDAFLGFLWALAERKRGFEGLLDPTSFLVLEKARALPQGAAQAIPASAQDRPGEGGDAQAVVSALINLGIPRRQAVQAVAQAQFPAGATLEEKIKVVLQGLGK